MHLGHQRTRFRRSPHNPVCRLGRHRGRHPVDGVKNTTLAPPGTASRSSTNTAQRAPLPERSVVFRITRLDSARNGRTVQYRSASTTRITAASQGRAIASSVAVRRGSANACSIEPSRQSVPGQRRNPVGGYRRTIRRPIQRTDQCLDQTPGSARSARTASSENHIPGGTVNDAHNLPAAACGRWEVHKHPYDRSRAG
jgi:hypothetical protein